MDSLTNNGQSNDNQTLMCAAHAIAGVVVDSKMVRHFRKLAEVFFEVGNGSMCAYYVCVLLAKGLENSIK